jgi:copper ion binding protein
MSTDNNKNNNLVTTRAAVKGMHCAACSSRIEKVLSGLAGVDFVAVNLAAESMEVRWNRQQTGLEEISAKVAALGFEMVLPAERSEIQLAIEGMSCASCSSRIEKVVGKLPGVEVAEINLAANSGRVVFDPEKISQRQIREQHRAAWVSRPSWLAIAGQLGYAHRLSGAGSWPGSCALRPATLSRPLIFRRRCCCYPLHGADMAGSALCPPSSLLDQAPFTFAFRPVSSGAADHVVGPEFLSARLPQLSGAAHPTWIRLSPSAPGPPLFTAPGI